MSISKRQVRQALGASTDSALAAFFGTSKQAICAWPEDGPIPELRQYQLRDKRPDLFDQAGALIVPASDQAAA